MTVACDARQDEVPSWRQSRLKPPTRFATLGGFLDRGVNLPKGRPRSAMEIAPSRRGVKGARARTRRPCLPRAQNFRDTACCMLYLLLELSVRVDCDPLVAEFLDRSTLALSSRTLPGHRRD
jgi:hypothetical protein